MNTMSRILRYTLVCILMAALRPATADEPGQRIYSTPISPASDIFNLRVGFVSGYLYAFHTGTIPSHADGIECPTFTNGSDNGFYVGGATELFLGSPVNTETTISLRSMYESLPAVFSTTPDKLASRSTGIDQDIIESSAVQTNTIRLSSISFEALFNLYTFDGAVGLSLGPTFNVYTGSEAVQRITLLTENARFENPLNYETEDYGSTLVLDRGTIEDLQVFSPGFKFNISANVNIGRVTFHPHAGFQYRFNSVARDHDWHVSALNIGLAISQVHSFGREL